MREQKTLLTMYITLLDDLADQIHDKETFEEGAKIPFEQYSSETGHSNVDSEYLSVVRDVWDEFETALQANPLYGEYEDVFLFDLRQALQSMRYGFLVNHTPTMANLSEAYALGSYNMVMFPYADIDLTYSPSFDPTDLGRLRGLIYECQQMARIGNWVSTWRREIQEGDLSSGVVIRAAEEGLFDPQMLVDEKSEVSPEEVIAAIEEADIADWFLSEWETRRERLEDEYSIESIDVTEFLTGMDTILEYHLKSQGKK